MLLLLSFPRYKHDCLELFGRVIDHNPLHYKPVANDGDPMLQTILAAGSCCAESDSLLVPQLLPSSSTTAQAAAQRACRQLADSEHLIFAHDSYLHKAAAKSKCFLDRVKEEMRGAGLDPAVCFALDEEGDCELAPPLSSSGGDWWCPQLVGVYMQFLQLNAENPNSSIAPTAASVLPTKSSKRIVHY